MDMDLRSQLDTLDDTPNSSTAYKGIDNDDSELVAQLRQNGSIDRLKQFTTNDRDIGQIDAVARSTASQHQSEMDEWEKEVAHQQGLLDAGDASQPVDILKSNMAYAQRKFNESRERRDQAQKLQRDSLSDFSVGFSHGALGATRSLAYALKQYGESLDSDRLAQTAEGVAGVLGDEIKDLPETPAWKDTHGITGFGRYLSSSAGGAAGSLLPFAVAGALGGEIPLLGTAIAAGHGQMREALENAGVTDKASLAKGTFTYGTLIGGLQIAVPWATMRALSKPAAEAFAGTIAQISTRVATGTARSSLEQMLAMGMATWAEIYGVHDTSGKPIDWDEVAQKVPEAMRQGAIAGTLFGGAGETGKLVGGGYKLKGGSAAKSGAPAGETGGGGPTARAEAVPASEAPAQPDPAVLQQELGTLATERGPEAEARRADLERQLAEVAPETAAEAQPADATTPEAPADPVAVVPTEVRSAVKDYLDSNDLPVEIPDHGLASIAEHITSGLTVDEAIAKYGQDQYQAEVAKRQEIPESGEQLPALDAGAIQRGGVTDQGLGEGRGRPGGAEAAPGTGEPLQPSVGADSAAGAEEQAARFSDILRAATPRREWAKALGADAGQMKALIANAEKQGLLRVDRNGVVRRTAAARTGEGIVHEDLGVRGVDVLQFIRSKGGLKPSGELKALDAKRYPGLINKAGLSADKMREAMVEAGYLEESGPDKPAVTTPQEVHDLLARAIGGERIVPRAAQQADEALRAVQSQKNEARELKHAEQTFVLPEIQRYDEDLGIPVLKQVYDSLDASTRSEVIDRNRRGEDIASLLEEMAVRGGASEDLLLKLSSVAPKDIPGEGSVALTKPAIERNAEMQSAVDAAAEKILPKSVRAEVVDRIEIARKQRDEMLAIRAYHGTPHDFDRFDMGRLGTGEGAQAYGHGLYFAEEKAVASDYRVKLSGGHSLGEVDGVPYHAADADHLAAKALHDAGNDQAAAIERLRSASAPNDRIEAAIAKLQGDANEIPLYKDTAPGRLYEVDIDVEPHQLLDWDKPLSEQIPAVREKIAQILPPPPERGAWETRSSDGAQVLMPRGHRIGDSEFNTPLADMHLMDNGKWWVGSDTLAKEFNTEATAKKAVETYIDKAIKNRDRTTSGASALSYLESVFGSREAASDALREAGIPGIRYLDQGSRNAAEGTRNIVIFDDSLVKITHKNGEPVTAAERKSVIDQMLSLRKGADVTDTPAFKQWFGDSKVVDAEGSPTVVYHGTARGGFDEFDTYGSKYGLMGQGGYFTENPAVASEYTGKGIVKMRKSGEEAQTVYPVYLSIKNPIDMDARADLGAWAKAYSDYLDEADVRERLGDAPTNERVYRDVEETLASEEIPSHEGAEIMQDGLRGMGHDGITHIGGGRVDPNGVKHRVWIAFDPEQIKSATGNRGTFDPNDSRMGFSLGQRQPEALGRTDPKTQIISIAARAVEAEAAATGVSAVSESVRVLRHEGVEFFKAMGMFTDKEWATLESTAKKQGWVESTGVREAYTELYREGMSDQDLNTLLVKEAIAEQYSEFHLGRKQFTGVVAKVFQRIKDFIDRAANTLKGMGFQKWDDIFAKIDEGQFKQRFDEATGDRGAGQDQLLAVRKAPEGEPPLRPGMVRVYHSGAAGVTGPRWVSTSREYAKNYRAGQPLHWMDLPETDPRVNDSTYPDQGVKQGFTFNFELSEAEAKNLKLASGVQQSKAPLGKKPPKSPIQETFDDIRAELGLKMPEGTKKGVKPTLRQQMASIASEGGEQVLRIYGKQFGPFLAKHGGDIEGFALPLSSDRLTEGFSRFFREFVLRPGDLRTRNREAYDDFADKLDAEAPQLFEAVDKMHELGKQRLAEIESRFKDGVAQVAGGQGGGTVPPGGPARAAGAAAQGPNIPGIPNAVVKPFADTFRMFSNGWKRNFQPELISTKALEADPLFAKYQAARGGEKDRVIKLGEERWDHWNKAGWDENRDMLYRVETGATQPTPERAEMAFGYRQMLDQAHRDEAVYGSKAGYVENYFGHIWKDAEEAKRAFEAKNAVQGLGPKWFQKERHFDLIEDGIRAGLELKTKNVEELIAMRLMAGADMRQRMELLRELKKMGLAREAKDASKQGFDQIGWQAVNAPNMEQWLLAPDIQPLWKNAVAVGEGLWEHQGAAGSFFRNWMAFKNAWVPVKLALSFFHPNHVYHINWTNNMARGFSHLLKGGDLRSAIRDVVTSFDPRVGEGGTARAAWLKPYEERSPLEKSIVSIMEDGGFRPQASEDLIQNARRNLQKAIQEHVPGKVAWFGFKRGLEAMSAPVFEHWIPGLKAAAYLKEAQRLLQRNPELLDDNILRRVGLRAIAKQIDDRFGEMNYSTLFWNKAMKQSLQGAFLSLGWQTGLTRQFGGAAIEAGTHQFPPSSDAAAVIRAATNKRAYSVIYIATAAVICGAMTKMLTDEFPEGWDYIFPRIGGKNPDGSPRRVTTMFYTREGPMLRKHIEDADSALWGFGEMAYNKMLIQPFVEIAQNRDYFGYEIWDQNATMYKKALQFGKHFFLDQMSPMAVSGASRSIELGETTGEKVKGAALSIMGFGPAPAYVERSTFENLVRSRYQTFVAPGKKPYAKEDADNQVRQAKDQLRLALQRGDAGAATEARKQAREAGAKSGALTQHRLGENPSHYMFSRLPEDEQRALLERAGRDDLSEYRKFASRPVRRDFPAQALH